jgi:hypothetical protein
MFVTLETSTQLVYKKTCTIGEAATSSLPIFPSPRSSFHISKHAGFAAIGGNNGMSEPMQPKG